MGIFEMIGGFVIILLCVVIIVAVAAQETKSGGLGSISGESTGTFFDKNRGKTKEAMLVRASAFSGIALALITLVVVIVSVR